MKPDSGQLQKAFSLDIDLAVAVHQNVRDPGIVQQRLEGTQAENFVQDLVADLQLLGGGEEIGLLRHDREHRLPDFAANTVVLDIRQRLQIDPVEQFVVQREFELLVLRL